MLIIGSKLSRVTSDESEGYSERFVFKLRSSCFSVDFPYDFINDFDDEF